MPNIHNPQFVVKKIKNLYSKFDLRLQDFGKKNIYFQLFNSPFSITEIETVPEKFQMELSDLKESVHLREKFNFTPINEFYKNLSAEDFPNLVNNAKYIYSLFG